MAFVRKRPLDPSRLRRPPRGGFGWIDRRLVKDGFIAALTPAVALLDFFLASIADHDGLSYFGDRRVGGLLKLSDHQLQSARAGLERKDLILFRSPPYQVLSLPKAPDPGDFRQVTLPVPAPPEPAAGQPDSARSLGSILRALPHPRP